VSKGGRERKAKDALNRIDMGVQVRPLERLKHAFRPGARNFAERQ
jgi:hypothetical protein